MSGDPYKYFRIEGRQLLDALSSGILGLESGAAHPGAAQELFRAAHTLKGAARIVGHRAIARASHTLEDYLAAMRATGVLPGPEEVQQMLDLLKQMEEELAKLEDPTTPTAASSSPATGIDPVLVRGQQHTQLLASLREAHTAVRHLAGLLDSPTAGSALVSDDEGSRADPTMLKDQLKYWLEVGLREIADSHERAGRLYYVPATELLPALELTVRDIANVQDKRVSVHTEGATLRIAMDYVTRLKPALVQLARNAVAHGIEPSSQRLRAGKPEVGRVTLGFRRAGRRLIVHCEDDGRGVNVAAVRQAAERRGLPTSALSDEDVLSLLVQTPISTTLQVDQTSGRGVGLELVGSVARALGGTARVSTRAGEGTRVELDMPASAGELDVLLVDARGQTYLLPLDRVRRGHVSHARLLAGQRGELAIDLDGHPIRLVDVDVTDPPRLTSDEPMVVVVLETSSGPVALQVDHVIELRTVILSEVAMLHLLDPVISGVALMEDGRLIPVLDPERLPGLGSAASPARAVHRQLRILVVDDSLTSRSLEQSILESAGYLVDTASSAEEGLRRTDEQRYSLCLVDVEMPGMDGFSFIRALRSRSETRDVPAILISSRNSDIDREAGRAAGAQDYMAKQEFDQARLLQRIEELTR